MGSIWRFFVSSGDTWLLSSPATWIWRVLLRVIILIRFRSTVLLPAAILHTVPGASCWGLGDPKPGSERQWIEDEERCSLYRKWTKASQGLPCSGFSLCCIVHLFLLPNVLFFFNIIKLLYPLFTAGFKCSCIGLGTNTHKDYSCPFHFYDHQNMQLHQQYL